MGTRTTLALLTVLLLAGAAAAQQTATRSRAETPILTLEPHGHAAGIWQVLFATGGRELLSVGDDRTIRVWDTGTGELVRVLRGQVGPGPEGSLFAAALSPDETTLATAGYGTPNTKAHWGDVRLWDGKTGQIRRLLSGHESTVNGLAFSKDGLLASASRDHTVRIWDAGTGQCRQVLRGAESDLLSVTWSPDGREVAAASLDQTVRVWDALQGGLPRLTLQGHTGEVRCVAWSPDGGTIASGSDDRTVRFWDARTGEARGALPAQDGTVVCAAYSPDGRRFVTGIGAPPGSVGVVRVWTVADGQVEREFARHDISVRAVAFSPDGKTIASAGGAAGEIYLWDPNTGEVKRRIIGTGRRPVAVAWSPDGTRVAWGNTVKLVAWNDAGPLEHSFDLRRGVPGPDVTPDQPWLRAVLRQGTRELGVSRDLLSVIIRDGGRDTARIRLRPNISYDYVRCFGFTPSGDVVVATGYVTALYNGAGKWLRTFIGYTGDVWALSVSPDGRYLATASEDLTVRVWPLHTQGAEVAPLLSIFAGSDGEWVAWTPQGFYTASASGDRLMGWQINRGLDRAADFYPAYQFRRALYRPDVLGRLIESGGTWEAVRLADAGANGGPRRQTNPALTAEHLETFLPPKVEIASPADGATVTDARTSVHVRIADANGRKIASARLLVNGRGQNGGALTAPTDPARGAEWSGAATLAPGENVVSVIAVNDAGAESLLTQLHVTYRAAEAGDTRPALYLLAVGVSRSRSPEPALKYPAKDAAEFAAAYRAQQGKLFGKVETRVLTDDQAGRAQIEDGLRWLSRQVTRRDWAVVFVAGHGTSDSSNGYFLPSADADPTRSKSSGLAWSELKTTLATLPERVLLVLDTAHSAGAAAERTREEDAYREVLRDAATDEAGLITFASCLPRERSLDSDGNGAFTRALVDGLGGKADANRDGTVTMAELDAYVTDRVQELTAGRQHPTVQRPPSISGNLPLAVVR